MLLFAVFSMLVRMKAFCGGSGKHRGLPEANVFSQSGSAYNRTGAMRLIFSVIQL